MEVIDEAIVKFNDDRRKILYNATIDFEARIITGTYHPLDGEPVEALIPFDCVQMIQKKEHLKEEQ